jgi:hypothetical protein
MMGLLVSLLGIGKTIRDFLAKLPWWVYAIVGAILAFLFAWHIHSGWEKAAYNDAYNAGWSAQKKLTDAEIEKNRVNLRSIGTLETALAGKNTESDARAKAFEQAKLDSASQVAALNARWAAGESARGRLQAILRNPPSAQCKVPSEVLSGLEGL